MIRIGLVGIGFMGMIHYLAARQLRGAAVTAIHSRDPKKLAGDWRGIQGNFGPPGEQMDLAGVKTYQRFDDLLADPDIDLIDLCNPTDLHRETAIRALEAGKHVLVEKAIAFEPADADAMLAAAAKAGRLLMVAHVLPFFPQFAWAAATVRGGAYGRMVGGHFKRINTRPDWAAESEEARKNGGTVLNLHIHDTHFISLLCGVPKRVISTGYHQNGGVLYLTTLYRYDNPPRGVSCSSGCVSTKARPFVHGFEIYLERATLTFESGTSPLRLLHADGRSELIELTGGDDPITAFVHELQAAVDGIAAGKAPDVLSGQLARDALVLCHQECESVRTGREIEIV